MPLSKHKRAVGIFTSINDAENALNELRSFGFPLSKVSLLARDSDRLDDITPIDVDVTAAHGNQAVEGATAGAVTGGSVGSVIGLLGALSALTIPGIGPVLAGGALATLIGNTIIGGAIGTAAGGLVGSLMGLGVPEDRAKVYNQRLSQGDYLLIVDGSEEAVRRAESILSLRGLKEWNVYDVPSSSLGYPSAYRTAGDRYDLALMQQKQAVGVFPTYPAAEHALQALKSSGFPMEKVSVIAKDSSRHENIAGVGVSHNLNNTKAEEAAKVGAVTGGALGGLTGLLIGLGALTIPGLGPILLAGAGATALATTITGGAVGAVTGGLLGALIGIGIPEERARVYSDRISRGEYLIIVNGTEDEIHHAEVILSNRGIQEWGIYENPEVTHSNYGHAVAPDVEVQTAMLEQDVDRRDRFVDIIDKRLE